ncbi:MAG TPA: NIPSNAP family protein [Roseiflexaceae bacterium]|mgnify:CR=1 FL=1|nr:NIPSNAP family protein [Roseiflexaceae bacterium]HMP41350.1 NIPSNAP family protein [Roseiflexaceae bacterium]
MVYELRTYWAAPGKIDALHARFRTLTLRIFERYAMQVVAFWTPTLATDASGDLVYIMAFADETALRQAWEAFRADAEWQAGKAASEVDGVLAARVESVVLTPTDYSPLQ